MNLIDLSLGLPIVAPFIAALLIYFNRNSNKHDFFALLIPFITLVNVVLLTLYFISLPAGQEIATTFIVIAPGLPIRFVLEPAGIIFACVVAILWPLSMLYTLNYLQQNALQHKTRFYIFYNIAIGCAFGIAFAGDLLTLLIFYEALTLSTYPLVTHYGDEAAKRAGRIYLGLLLGTSILLLLPGVIWVWSTTGTLSFAVGGILPADTSPWLLLLLVLGVGKAALMPLHRWLPAAMVAPAPVSALLHAVAVVKAGVFTLAKILIYIFGFDLLADLNTDWLIYLAGTSVVVAAFIALRQKNLKKVLAYSTVSHLSYIAMGLLLLKPAALGAILHLVSHAFGKITLFFAAGAIQTVSNKKSVSELHGIGHLMPWTMVCFAIAAISLIGLPPTFGLTSKWYLLRGAIDVEHYFAVAVIIIGSVLNAAYFIPIVYRAFTKRCEATHGEASIAMIIAMVIPVALLIILFLFSNFLIDLATPIL